MPFALYESLFPVESGATPQRQHVVLFFRAVLEHKPEFHFSADEIDAWCWLDGTTLGRGFLDGFPCVEASDLFAFEEVPSRRSASAPLLELQGLPDPVSGQYLPNRLSTGELSWLDSVADTTGNQRPSSS